MFITVCLELVEPGLHRNKRLRSEPEDSGTGVLRRALVADDPCVEQHAQVPAHRRGGGSCGRRQLARAPGAGTENLDHTLPSRIGQRPEQDRELIVHHFTIVVTVVNCCQVQAAPWERHQGCALLRDACANRSPAGVQWSMALRMKWHLGQAIPQLAFEPVPMRLRAFLDGDLVLDTQRAVLVWEPRRIVPVYAVPEDDLLLRVEPTRSPPEPPDLDSFPPMLGPPASSRIPPWGRSSTWSPATGDSRGPGSGRTILTWPGWSCSTSSLSTAG